MPNWGNAEGGKWFSVIDFSRDERFSTSKQRQLTHLAQRRLLTPIPQCPDLGQRQTTYYTRHLAGGLTWNQRLWEEIPDGRGEHLPAAVHKDHLSRTYASLANSKALEQPQVSSELP